MKYVVYVAVIIVAGFIISIVTRGGRESWNEYWKNFMNFYRIYRRLPKEERNKKELLSEVIPLIAIGVVIIIAFVITLYGTSHWEEINQVNN